MKRYKTVLTIGGSDSSAGVGIQADLKTFLSLGCYGVTAITAITAQNTQGVQAIKKISAKFVSEQLTSIFVDIKVDAIKTGLLLSEDIINVVADFVGKWNKRSFIVDPVMIGKNGKFLLNKDARKIMFDKLFPKALLVTPNISEAEQILKCKIFDLNTMQEAARRFCDLGAKAVLVKGGNLTKMKDSVDCLYIKKEKKFYWFKKPRVYTKNTRGAGCTLSAAIASFMAQGDDLLSAITKAKKYVTKAILVGSKCRLGSGPGPVGTGLGIDLIS